MKMFAGLRAVLFLALAAAMPAAAQVRADPGQPATLRPGEYVWYDEARPVPVGGQPAPVSIVVSIPAQLGYVYRDGTLIGISTVSTGRDGHDTPTGEFTILQKRVFHRSNLYSNAPMPYMQRLTWDGIALHGGHLPGYPASHGCIRLPNEFARRLFQLTELGGTVAVIDEWVDDPRFNPWAPPVLRPDPEGLGGDAFDVVTVSDEPWNPQPVSWVLGPRQEIVQPVNGERR